MLIGIGVYCAKCGRRKAPHGRSVPDAMYGSLCTADGCEGYGEIPLPGCLWPGETSADFGYDCCDNAAVEIEVAS